jgi:hypothetical protein
LRSSTIVSGPFITIATIPELEEEEEEEEEEEKKGTGMMYKHINSPGISESIKMRSNVLSLLSSSTAPTEAAPSAFPAV